MTEYTKTLILGVNTVQDYNKTLGVSTVLADPFWPTIFVETSKLTDIGKLSYTDPGYFRARRPRGAIALTGPHPLLNDVIQADII